MSDAIYFVRVKGHVSGPYAVEDLKKLVRRGMFSMIHQVSTDRQNWQPARLLTEVFPPVAPAASRPSPAEEAIATVSFSETELLTTVPNEAEETTSPVTTSTPPLRLVEPSAPTGARLPLAVRRLSLTDGLCTAAVLLFCLNIPHGRVDGHLTWWWNFWEPGGELPLLPAAILALLTGIGLMAVALVTRGTTRGWIYLAAGMLEIMLLTLGVGITASPFVGVAIILPLLVVAMIAVSIVRARLKPAAGLLPGMLGGVTCLAAMVAGIGLAVTTFSASGSEDGMWAVGAVALISLACLGGLGCGIMGLVGLKRRFSPTVNTAGVVTGLCCLGFLILACAVAAFGLAGLEGESGPDRFVAVRLIRLLVTVLSLSALSAIGLLEILTSRAGPAGVASNPDRLELP